MLELNLIREKTSLLEESRKYLRYFKISYLVLIALLAVSIVQLTNIYGKTSANRKEAERISRDIEKTKGDYGISALEAEWAGYSRLLTSAQGDQAQRTKRTSLLKSLIALVPEGMRLEKADIGLLPEGTQGLTISAVVFPEDRQGLEVANELISRMEKDPCFSGKAKLESNEKTQVNGRDAEMFRIVVPVK